MNRELLIEELGSEFVNELGEEFVPAPEVVGPEDADQWHLLFDGDGNLRIVDVYEPEDEITPFFNVNTDVIFRVFTRRNPTAGQVITIGNAASIANSQFTSAHPTR